MELKNNTVYDEEILRDGIKILTKKYKITVAFFTAFLLAMSCYYAVFYGVKGHVSVIIIPIVGALIVVGLGVFKTKSYSNMIKERLKVVNHQEKVKMRFVFDNEKTIAENENGNNVLYHKDIKKIIETKLQYVIIYNGNVFILVSKNGFEGEDEKLFVQNIKSMKNG